MFHDTRVGMAEAVPQIAALLRDNGYMAVAVDELAAAYGIALEPGQEKTPAGHTRAFFTAPIAFAKIFPYNSGYGR